MRQPDLIGIVSQDEAFSTASSAALGVGGARLRLLKSWSDWSKGGVEPSVLVFDGAATGSQDLAEVELRLRDKATSAVCVVADDGEAISALTSHAFLNCVVSRSGGFHPGDLAPLVANLVAGRAAGIEAYLGPGSAAFAEVLTDYSQKDACLERLLAYVSTLPSFVDFPQIAVSVVWEMLMNALIDAPSQAVAAGKSKAAGVQLRYGSDGRHLAVSVQDHYGSLTRAKVVENLQRSHRQGPDQIRSGVGGAGIGLYLMFNHACQLHFSVQPGVSTRVVLVMRVSKRYGEFTEGGRAFNFMIEGDR